VNPEVARHSPLILIVDNAQRNRDLLQTMLAAQGFEVQSAARGEQGLAMIFQDMPDLILPDVMMAVWMAIRWQARSRVTAPSHSHHHGHCPGRSGRQDARTAVRGRWSPQRDPDGAPIRILASTKTSVASSTRKGNRPNGRRACRLPMQ
jgi:CheY-like chemotaxis protein